MRKDRKNNTKVSRLPQQQNPMSGQSSNLIELRVAGLLLGRVAREMNNLELRVVYTDELREKKTKAS